MRHEYTVKYPCPACGCPMIQIATYCCSDVADLICKSCNETRNIPYEQAKHIHDNYPFAFRSFGGGLGFLVPTPKPEDKRKPGVIYFADLRKQTDEEREEFRAMMEKYGYIPKGGQIGFVGNRQAISPPIEVVPPEHYRDDK